MTETDIFICSRHFIWQKKKPVQKGFHREMRHFMWQNSVLSMLVGPRFIEGLGLQSKTRPIMRQMAFTLNQAIKCLKGHLMTAIMAEKRQELSQTTIE